MQLKHKILILSSTPQRLNVREVVDSRSTLSVQNIVTTGYAYLGNSSVTTTNYGHKLYPAQSFTIEMSSNDDIWAVGDSGVEIAIFIQDRE